ncbi:unnamed protein product [Colias eurytheme]|nr:unnamed protein product [Colias eurytheme]
MFVNGDPLPQCPVVGPFEEIGWQTQCPVSGQWSKPPVKNVCGYNVYSANVNGAFSTQCYNNNVFVCDNPGFDQFYSEPPLTNGQHYYPRVAPHPQLMQPNLPCQQRQEWDYNSMCYNVNGTPCQFTNVVDLEDFM